MEKEKKVVKKAPKAETKKVAEPKKADKPVAKKSAPATAKKVEVVEEVKVNEVKAEKPAEVKVVKKAITLNQDLNLIIGLFAIITLLSFCLAFQGGDNEIIGWNLLLDSGKYLGGIFKGIMIIYVISLFIDCLLAVRIDCDNEVLNTVEKVLYMFTLIMNFVVNAILLSLIKKVGIGLILFLIISIVAGIVKLARIYSQK